MDTGVYLTRRHNSRGMTLTTYLLPRLRMSGALPLLSPYAHMACTATSLPFTILILPLETGRCELGSFDSGHGPLEGFYVGKGKVFPLQA